MVRKELFESTLTDLQDGLKRVNLIKADDELCFTGKEIVVRHSDTSERSYLRGKNKESLFLQIKAQRDLLWNLLSKFNI